MNLQPFFKMQYELDDRIIDEKGLEGQDLVPNTFLASLVELAECANEHRGFKHWSNDQEPRTKALRHPAMMEEDKEYYNPLLEEFIDKFHFLLSLGNQLGFSEQIQSIDSKQELDITHQFLALFYTTSALFYFPEFEQYNFVLRLFFGLGEMLGFTWDDITNSYKEKNAINHLRQSSGY